MDAKNIDNSFYLELNPTSEAHQTILRGFRIDSDTIQALMFSDVNTGTGPRSPADATSKAGLLQVSMYVAECFQPVSITYPATSAALTLSRIDENKKIWQPPSLATTRGKNLPLPFYAASFRKKRMVPDDTIAI